MTIISANTGRFIGISAVRRWVQAIVARSGRPARSKNITRAEFEQMARDLDLSQPELYGLLTGRKPSAAAVESYLTESRRFPADYQGATHARIRRRIRGSAGLPTNWAVLLLNQSLALF